MNANVDNLPTPKFGSIEELQAFHDTRFIRLAYQCVLGRDPDPDGLAFYQANLRSNIGSAQLLAILRNSPEIKRVRQAAPAVAQSVAGEVTLRSYLNEQVSSWLDK
ncbi:MAG: DUF4214 domain-containing protein [Methylobacter sp.]